MIELCRKISDLRRSLAKDQREALDSILINFTRILDNIEESADNADEYNFSDCAYTISENAGCLAMTIRGGIKKNYDKA